MLNRTFGRSFLLVSCLVVCSSGALMYRQPEIVFAHAAELAQGAELYNQSGCTHCHGVTGSGTDKGPSLRGVRRRITAAQIERQIVNGGQEMPAFGSTLDHKQVQNLVAFLREKTPFPESEGTVPSQ